MQQENDHIKREVEKITQFLKHLFEKVSKSSFTVEEIEVSKEFTETFNFNLTNFVSLKNKIFIENTQNLHTEILENLAFLFAELSKKTSIKNQILYA